MSTPQESSWPSVGMITASDLADIAALIMRQQPIQLGTVQSFKGPGLKDIIPCQTLSCEAKRKDWTVF